MHQIGAQNEALYETFWELMCYFEICLDVNSSRGNVNGLKSWVEYLFHNLESIPEDIHTLVAEADIEALMVVSGHGDIVLEEDDKIYEKGKSFKSYHHQTRQSVSRSALLAGCLLSFAFFFKLVAISLIPKALILNSDMQELEALYHWENSKLIKRLVFLSGMQKWFLCSR